MSDRPRYKTVLLPIEVPQGEYCWDGETPCEYFDNEGGHGRCTIPGLYAKSIGKGRWEVKKADECLAAQESDEVSRGA